jgi:putative glutathione S-transferase
VLWDKERATIVSNESADIIRMLNAAFSRFSNDSIDLYPRELAAEIDALNELVYRKLNNGVYRTGFATTQQAYDEGFADVFDMLDELESRLQRRTFLIGERLTEADVRAFVTLVRFDNAYHGVFKCNRQRLADYPNLTAYLARILAIPGVRETVSIEHIKRGYYSIKTLNPNGIVPLGPQPALP